ncbi:MAG: class I SAM-dependent methyltransferase [Actinomycetota bacterium]
MEPTGTGTPSRPGNYAEQAGTYDLTRGASPTIVRRLRESLGPSSDRALLDVAGGTGNYGAVLRDSGFGVTMVDASFEMLARSVPKVGRGRQVVGDAAALPFADGAFDCAVCVIAIHLFADRPRAFREARRVLRAGPFVVVAYTKENLGSLFVHAYFGGAWPGGEFTTSDVRSQLEAAGFGRVTIGTFVYEDVTGGSLVAMHTDATFLADPDRLRNTSFWHRFPDSVREEALARLQADLASGVLGRRVDESLRRAAEVGHGTVFTAFP